MFTTRQRPTVPTPPLELRGGAKKVTGKIEKYMGQLIHNRKAMEVFRWELRKTQTSTEAMLWERLRSSQLEGRKFRRQHSVGVYILDFYCPAERLCIEIDGESHQNSEAIVHDEVRDTTLAQLQIRTLRISNDEVEADIESVLQKIKDCFKA